MCGKERLRYIHTMEHADHADLDVGRICAGKMATNYDAAAAEKKLKAKAGVRSRWLSRRWRTSAKGNPFLLIDGLVLGIAPFRGGWRYWITEQDGDGTFRGNGRSYLTPDEAKLALFEAYWQAKQGPDQA